MTNPHVSDIGTIIQITITEDGVALDISSATTKEIILKKPSGTLLTKTATFTTVIASRLKLFMTFSSFLQIPRSGQIATDQKSSFEKAPNRSQRPF